METWNLFNGNDIIIGLLGAAGLLSMFVVIFTASSRVDKREKILKAAREVAKQLEEMEDVEQSETL